VLYWSGVEANESDNDPTHLVFFTSAPLNASSRILDLRGAQPVVTTPGDPDGSAGDLFCSGQVILPDGRVMAAGGSDWKVLPDIHIPLTGLKDTRVFDPADSSWHRTADMGWARWYPSVIEGSDGKAIAASGIDWLTNPTTMIQQMERYEPGNDSWNWIVNGDNLLPMYPRLTVVPGGPLKGELFYSTVGTLWGPFGEHPLQALWSLQQVYDGQQWRILGPSLFGARQYPISLMLMLDSGNGYAPRFLTAGGTLQQTFAAVPLAEMADLSTDPPTNSLVAPLHHARWFGNGVLLPDGQVLDVGGGMYDNVVAHGIPNQPVLPAELFDPATGAWTDTAAMTVPRMYHSTALLLPDGRVLAGGHVPLPDPSKVVRDLSNPQIVETRLEIFDPPYLFRGARPVIEEAPDSVAYGEVFHVRAQLPQGLHDVVLMHPGATTHGFDTGQRGIRLDVLAQGDGDLTLRAPPDSDVAPPGSYMLFVNGDDAQGPVPSVARFVHLG
jgi:hypothetical protein